MLGAVVWLCVCGLVASDLNSNGKIDSRIGRLKKIRDQDSLYEDAALKVPGLVRKYGYPLEEHRVTTKDGYILTIHRLPYGRNNQNKTYRPAVFIMHGLLSSSADWVLTGPNKGLAYILAEEGFDVWLGNARGNRYSRRHVTLNPDVGAAFWQFSWDEIGNIDLPTMIDSVLETTKKRKLHYIGHSQGTTSFFVMCSMQPEYNDKIISMNALAPVAYMAHSGSPLIRAIAPFSNAIDNLTKTIGQGELLPMSNSLLMRWAGKNMCSNKAVFQEMCANILFLVGGWNSVEFNRTILPVILSHSPAGASIRQFVHYGQNMHSTEFRRFNYGQRNFIVYGTLKAPPYNLTQVRAPVFLRYSLSDPLAHVKDVKRLSKELGNVKANAVIPMKTFSHLDFLWGIHAKELLYDQVITDMKKMQDIEGSSGQGVQEPSLAEVAPFWVSSILTGVAVFRPYGTQQGGHGQATGNLEHNTGELLRDSSLNGH